jgi:hypothetical protein
MISSQFLEMIMATRPPRTKNLYQFDKKIYAYAN